MLRSLLDCKLSRSYLSDRTSTMIGSSWPIDCSSDSILVMWRIIPLTFFSFSNEVFLFCWVRPSHSSIRVCIILKSYRDGASLIFVRTSWNSLRVCFIVLCSASTSRNSLVNYFKAILSLSMSDFILFASFCWFSVTASTSVDQVIFLFTGNYSKCFEVFEICAI